MAALAANFQVLVKFFGYNHLNAVVALGPKAFRDSVARGGALQKRILGLLKPWHVASASPHTAFCRIVGAMAGANLPASGIRFLVKKTLQPQTDFRRRLPILTAIQRKGSRESNCRLPASTL